MKSLLPVSQETKDRFYTGLDYAKQAAKRLGRFTIVIGAEVTKISAVVTGIFSGIAIMGAPLTLINANSPSLGEAIMFSVSVGVSVIALATSFIVACLANKIVQNYKSDKPLLAFGDTDGNVKG